MRILGPRTPLSVFRWDLVYLAAQLESDDRPGVAPMAQGVHAAVVKVREQRAALEQAEDASLIATAHLHKRDQRRDAVLVEMGGVARAADKEAYATMFGKRNPTQTAKLGIDAESVEIGRILGEMGKLPAAHPVRLAYEAPLSDAQKALVPAKGAADQAALELSLARSEMERFKLAMDELRLSIHGQLLTMLTDKAEVEAFFRPATLAPAVDGAEAEPAPTP